MNTKCKALWVNNIYDGGEDLIIEIYESINNLPVSDPQRFSFKLSHDHGALAIVDHDCHLLKSFEHALGGLLAAIGDWVIKKNKSFPVKIAEQDGDCFSDPVVQDLALRLSASSINHLEWTIFTRDKK